MKTSVSNCLKAEVVNRFLYMLNNPEICPVQDPLNPYFRAELCKCLCATINENAAKDENSPIAAALKEAGAAFTEAFIASVIEQNRRTVPYLEEDVEFAHDCNQDILSCCCSPDTNMHPSRNDVPSKEGYRIL